MTTTTLEPQTESIQRFAERVLHVPRSGMREILGMSNVKSMISFGGGIPPESCIPVDSIRSAFERVLSRHGAKAFSYGQTEGEPVLREFIAKTWLPRLGFDANPEQVLIVNGSQQALDLLGKALIDPGTPVLIERPTYLAALQAFAAYRPSYSEIVPETEHSTCEQLTSVLCRRTPRFFYTIPTFQNPSGICYSLRCRHNVVELLNSHGVRLVEDDPYSQLYFESPPGPPMSTLGAREPVFLGTFSKTVAPGFRLGWIYASGHLMRHLITLKQAADLCTGRFQQLLLYETLTHMDLENHLECTRAHYRKKRDMFHRLLHRYASGLLRWSKPTGGMFFWAALTGLTPASAVLKACVQEGVAFADGAAFHAHPGGAEFLRLNFTQASESQMEQGIRILARQIEMLSTEPAKEPRTVL